MCTFSQQNTWQGQQTHLEAHVHDTRDVLCAVEVLSGGVATLLSLAAVVHQVLGDLTQSSALLAEVDDQARAAASTGIHTQTASNS